MTIQVKVVEKKETTYVFDVEECDEIKNYQQAVKYVANAINLVGSGILEGAKHTVDDHSLEIDGVNIDELVDNA